MQISMGWPSSEDGAYGVGCSGMGWDGMGWDGMGCIAWRWAPWWFMHQLGVGHFISVVFAFGKRYTPGLYMDRCLHTSLLLIFHIPYVFGKGSFPMFLATSSQASHSTFPKLCELGCGFLPWMLDREGASLTTSCQP
jgi:hypothetical protein